MVLKPSGFFFATAHGKTSCDGIGGTVKRLTASASLQERDSSRQILNTQDMFKFCQKDIDGIEFFYISKEDVSKVRLMLQERFDTTRTLPGTRRFHQFKPKNVNTIQYE